MTTGDTNRKDGHRRVVRVGMSKELLHDVQAIGWALDKSEEDATTYLLELGRSAFMDRDEGREIFNLSDGRSLVMTRTIRGQEMAWLRRRTKSGWVVSYRLVPKAGRPAVAEVRVFPDEGAPAEEGHGSTWSGDDEMVPEGGLPGRVVRDEVHVVDDLALVATKLGEFRKHFGQFTWDTTIADRLAPAKRGKGRRNDRRIAEVAAIYGKALDRQSKSPAKDAAKELGLAAERVHEIMFKARDRGIWKGGRPGRAGGGLTQVGRALLEGRED